PPSSTRVPYTTLFRSWQREANSGRRKLSGRLVRAGMGEEYRVQDTRLERHSFFTDIFSPDFRVADHVFSEHLDTFVRMGVEDFRSEEHTSELQSRFDL